MALPRIYADFHNLDDANRVRLTCAGTKEDLERQHITLKDGMVLTFAMDDADDQGNPDDLLVDGTVHFDQGSQVWVAEVDWSAVRHASDDQKAANGASRAGAATKTNI